MQVTRRLSQPVEFSYNPRPAIVIDSPRTDRVELGATSVKSGGGQSQDLPSCMGAATDVKSGGGQSQDLPSCMGAATDVKSGGGQSQDLPSCMGAATDVKSGFSLWSRGGTIAQF